MKVCRFGPVALFISRSQRAASAPCLHSPPSPVAQVKLCISLTEPQVGSETLTEILSAFRCFPPSPSSRIRRRDQGEGRIERGKLEKWEGGTTKTGTPPPTQPLPPPTHRGALEGGAALLMRRQSETFIYH